METITRVQTAFRLREDLLERLKYKAKRQNMSLNAYVEQVLDEETRTKIPKLPKDFKIDPVLASFCGFMKAPTQEQLDSDPKLAYLWEKGLCGQRFF